MRTCACVCVPRNDPWQNRHYWAKPNVSWEGGERLEKGFETKMMVMMDGRNKKDIVSLCCLSETLSNRRTQRDDCKAPAFRQASSH